MQAVAIIAASGIGKRMQLKGGVSKQMLQIAGYPVIYHTLKAFENASTIKEIYIATKKEAIASLEELVKASGFKKVKRVIEGGLERQDSVNNCIKAIEQEIRSSAQVPDVIMVHDGARPFIQSHEIDEIACLTIEHGACVPANRPKDTIKHIGSHPGFFGETLDRSKLLQVQTPQSFLSRLLIQAHEQAELEQWYATDDAALVERFFPEQNIRILETGYHNIKITTPEDIRLAEAIYNGMTEKIEEEEKN
ncbi:2-C-methyl-D-erythritol 4-phosphate cytidylyltransferase [Chlorobium phaeobacteroides]|uniref:2-C-methyl-D-erythritol 4-phosphate cytidylyltransferase n=1 Tax=Chlorobium phaeobacteroides TaxID=1096 RepID=UPI00059E06F8|nr:2-C-methyl-D-erythritol 4-phosphate cytidylyltransferase [Chlorobium phaeobacteroides]MBV5328372.1 2-C-methyl-D-erythritol 4-phosphate cytidylyltransferase [Chlorobium sp.]